MIARCLLALLLATAFCCAQTPSPAASPAAVTAPATKETALPAIRASVQLPEGWFMREQTDDGVTVYQLTREKVESDNDSFTAGLILSVTTKVPERAEMKASAYAEDLLSSTSDDSPNKLKKTTEGPYQVMRTDYQIDAEQSSLQMTNLAKANDASGTLYFITWQSPIAEEAKLAAVREAILASFKFDPNF